MTPHRPEPAGAVPRGRRDCIQAYVCVALIACAVALHAWVAPSDTSARVGPLLLVGAGAAWWLALRAARGGSVELRVVIGGALLLRALAFAGGPLLSDDVYRYVWEGELVRSGRSPYAHAPSAPEHAALRERLPEVAARINHPDVSAAYPPLTQYACAAAVSVAHAGRERPGLRGVGVLRALFGLCDLLVLLPLVRLLRRAGRPPGLALAWGWSPLVVVEFAGSGHFDALGILLLVLALAAAPARRAAAAALLAASMLTKWLPLLLVPVLVRGRRAGLAFGAVCALLMLPILALADGTRGLFRGLGEYATRWEGGGLLYPVLVGVARGLPEPGGLGPVGLARGACVLGMLLVCVRTWRRRGEPLAAAPLLIGAFLVLTPVLHPWYLAWIVPFLALRPSRAWSWLVVVAPLAYAPLAAYRAGAEWVDPAWRWPLVALPFFLLLVMDVRATRAQALSPA